VSLPRPEPGPADLLVARGHRHARAHHVEAHAEFPHFARDRLGERDHPGLARAVHALAELAHAAGVRAHADDGARLARDHAVEHGAGAVDHAPEVDLDLLLPFLTRLLHAQPLP